MLAVVAVVALALVGFWAFGLWSRITDARSPSDDAQVSTHGSAGDADAVAATTYDPGQVYVLGDSLTSTAYNAHGAGKGAPEHVSMEAWPGWSAAEAQPALNWAVADGKVDTLVLALGTNDSTFAWGRGGWDEADVQRFRQVMATPDPTVCIVVVLPGYGAGIEPSHSVEMDQARDDLVELVLERRADPDAGPTAMVDWQTQVRARPELLADDGIHLVPDPEIEIDWPAAEAAAARMGLYWHGVAGCANG